MPDLIARPALAVDVAFRRCLDLSRRGGRIVTMTDLGLPFRISCRGLVFDDDERVLLAQHQTTEGAVWVGPGGGVEGNETLVEALARELLEETGLSLIDPTAPALVWTQAHRFPEMQPHGFSGVLGHYFVVPLRAFTRQTGSPPDAHTHSFEEGVTDMRWWSLDEVEAANQESVLFSPRAFPRLMGHLLNPSQLEELQRVPLQLGL